ncbi:MAG TPA: hypothetical protein VGY48_19490 [Vicinamibacterales bacterium]|nr:hypothetical protein [Vicinamibacterales bacterium]
MTNPLIVSAIVLPILLAHAPGRALGRASQPPPSTACREWRECQRLALDAAERRDYEAFHDLAWRAVQTGPSKDPALMYLLARAQCLSGRPHDALIMLERLAAMGVATDADTSDDFQRTRALPGWTEVATAIEQIRIASLPAGSARAPSGAPALPAPRPDASDLMAFAPETVEQPVRVSTPRFAAGGLAYDAVSRRFVVGDHHGRKLLVVREGADHTDDLVRADSAGFREIAAIEVDGRRGDLWVATGIPDGSNWALHKLQLVSGRLLRAFPVAAKLEPLKIIDLAVSHAGVVLALDSLGSRLFVLRPGRTSLEPLPKMALPGLASVAATSDELTVYVAHAAGVARVDLRSGTVLPVVAPAGLEFGVIERLRWHRNALLTVESDANGSRRVVRFSLDASGRAVTAATIIDASIPAAAGPTFATVSDDELSYIIADPDRSGVPSQDTPPAQLADFIIRRIHLQRDR